MTEYSHLTGKYEGNLFVCFKGYKLFFTTAQIFMALWKSHQYVIAAGVLFCVRNMFLGHTKLSGTKKPEL